MIARLRWLLQRDLVDEALVRSLATSIALERIRTEQLERPAPDPALIARIVGHVPDPRFLRRAPMEIDERFRMAMR